jgi:hypothetical protein
VNVPVSPFSEAALSVADTVTVTSLDTHWLPPPGTVLTVAEV